MHYYIDGYNLMFRVLRAGDELKIQREQVISDLAEKIQTVGLNATLVFDAQYQAGEGSRGAKGTLEIRFTDEGETADDFILRKLKASSSPELETIVTSDRRLAHRARRLLAHSLSVDEFMDWLGRRHRNILKGSRSKIQRKHHPPPATKGEPRLETEMERWLRIFEQRLKEIEEGKSPY